MIIEFKTDDGRWFGFTVPDEHRNLCFMDKTQLMLWSQDTDPSIIRKHCMFKARELVKSLPRLREETAKLREDYVPVGFERISMEDLIKVANEERKWYQKRFKLD